MAILARMTTESDLPGAGPAMEIDLDSSHKVLNMVLEALQHGFKKDKAYERPLISPQANILFALDKETATSMATYMSTKLMQVGNFVQGDFRFTHKSGSNGEALQRLRLEFPEGLNAHIIRKLLFAIEQLKTMYPAYQA
jgi:hypothetical protein